MILRSRASTHAALRSKASQRTALPLATKTACLREDFFKMLRHVAQSVGQITRNNALLFEILLTSCSKCSASAAPQSAIHFSLREKNLHEAIATGKIEFLQGTLQETAHHEPLRITEESVNLANMPHISEFAVFATHLHKNAIRFLQTQTQRNKLIFT